VMLAHSIINRPSHRSLYRSKDCRSK